MLLFYILFPILFKKSKIFCKNKKKTKKKKRIKKNIM